MISSKNETRELTTDINTACNLLKRPGLLIIQEMCKPYCNSRKQLSVLKPPL